MCTDSCDSPQISIFFFFFNHTGDLVPFKLQCGYSVWISKPGGGGEEAGSECGAQLAAGVWRLGVPSSAAGILNIAFVLC